MFLESVNAVARRDVRRALSEEAAVDARGNAASSCDERFILVERYMDDGRHPGCSHEMASELQCSMMGKPRASLKTGLGYVCCTLEWQADLGTLDE